MIIEDSIILAETIHLLKMMELLPLVLGHVPNSSMDRSLLLSRMLSPSTFKITLKLDPS